MTSPAIVAPLKPVPHVLAVRCNFCSRQQPWHRCHKLSGAAQVICDDCIDRHNASLEFLAGNLPDGCMECSRSMATLRDTAPGVEIRMYVVPKDGVLQTLCADCTGKYLPKRADLYRGTRFGDEVLKV